jgi:hypothetical protein
LSAGKSQPPMPLAWAGWPAVAGFAAGGPAAPPTDAGGGVESPGGPVGREVGNEVGSDVGNEVGSDVGNDVGREVGSEVGSAVGNDVGNDVGRLGRGVGSTFGGLGGDGRGMARRNPLPSVTAMAGSLLFRKMRFHHHGFTNASIVSLSVPVVLLRSGEGPWNLC